MPAGLDGDGWHRLQELTEVSIEQERQLGRRDLSAEDRARINSEYERTQLALNHLMEQLRSTSPLRHY